MNRLVKTLALTAPLLSAALLSSGSADACGGCFHPPTSSTVVSGHRMALSVSMKQTVLWDQIQYQGDPTEFSWVLPIKPGARIELASNDFFDTLEAATVTTVEAPPLNCGNSGQAFGCGSSAVLAASDGAEGTGGGDHTVTVVKHETIGPYEQATLSSKDAGALTGWLEMHGYEIPDDVKPIINAYVNEGFDFIALRLVPGNGVNLMQPVRVVTQGANPAMPLRMVAAGAGANIGIVLYVISEGRWTTSNFVEGKVKLDDLTWQGDTNESNYAQLREDALAANLGKTWIASYAQKDVLFNYQYDDGTGFGSGGIGQAYFQQILDEQGTNWDEISACNQRAQNADPSAAIVDTCDHDTMVCGTAAPGEVDARDFTCGELSDLSTALVGMHLKDVWITRLEANLPRIALSTDLLLKASDDQSLVQNYHQAPKAENYECPAAPVSGSKNGKGTPSGNGTAFILAGLGAMAALLAARRGRLVRA